MSIAGKHWYRFNFLKSDEWRNFRLQVLTDCGGKCCCCGLVDPSNDVHHVWYGEPSYCGVRQFVVLCRSCHDKVHSFLVPVGAKSESERKDAWKQFSIAVSKVRVLVRKPPVPIVEPRGPCPPCRGCHKSDNVFRLNPVTLEIDPDQKTAIGICAECFAVFSRCFHPLVFGKSFDWKERLGFLDKLKEIEFDNTRG